MQRQDEALCASFSQEFVGADLADRRREDRLVEIARQLRAAPKESLPDLAPTQADLTAMYRFLGASKVKMGAVMEPHIQATARRCAEARTILVIYDTSEMELKGDTRRGLGPLRGESSRGFFLHPALAVASDGSRRPLGLLGAITWKREEGTRRSRNPDGSRKNGGAYHRETEKESARWWELVAEVEDRLEDAEVGAAEAGLDEALRIEAIHVADREADAFHIVRDAQEHGARFVIRMARDRVLLDEDDDERIGRTSEVLACCEDMVTLEVPVTKRAGNTIPRALKGRSARVAKLGVTATKARIARPNYDRTSAEGLDVNIVCVREIDPPDGVEPIGWVLITSEPIDTKEQVIKVVEIYRTRWMIEEFFKALKQGCAFESRELESYHTLTNALGIFLPIAWHLLLLRHLAEPRPDVPATAVLSPTQIQILRARVPKLVPAHPSASDALRAVAYLGGHFIKRRPGWLVLGRGLEELLSMEVGWRLARGMELEM